MNSRWDEEVGRNGLPTSPTIFAQQNQATQRATAVNPALPTGHQPGEFRHCERSQAIRTVSAEHLEQGNSATEVTIDMDTILAGLGDQVRTAGAVVELIAAGRGLLAET
jgi:hypothetical protein